jgi:hypothetical protein
MSAVLSPSLHEPATALEPAPQTDGFHLLIDALKLNGITNVYGLPGIPITDLTRMLQAEGMRMISFAMSKTPVTRRRLPASSTVHQGCASRSQHRASSTGWWRSPTPPPTASR